MRFLVFAAAFCCAFLGTGCSTSTKVVTGQGQAPAAVRSAFVVQHENPPDDMDIKMEKALARQNLTVTAGKSDSGASVDLVVKYDDHWMWDVAMYLRALEVQFYDGRTGALLATGQWSDSAFHGFRDSEKVCADLVAEVFTKLGWEAVK